MRPPNYPSEKLEREHTTKTVTCESALREAGIDETLLAKKLKELLEAKRPWWNPKKQAFDLFPDDRARLAALRLAFKILGSYPAEREDNELLVINTSEIPAHGH